MGEQDVSQKMLKIPLLIVFHIMFPTPAHCLQELEKILLVAEPAEILLISAGSSTLSFCSSTDRVRKKESIRHRAKTTVAIQ